jgi:putative Flp pilus-assembly TadE/G-like protein
MKKLRRFWREGEDGQAVVLFALLMLALLFMVGLAIDAGQLYSNKRTEQEAADAAAFAGAVILYQAGSGAQAITAATADAQTNGYVSDDPSCPVLNTGNTCVTVNWPPSSGGYAGRTDHIEVIIVRKVLTSLVPAEAAFNPVRARGVAGAENLNSGYAIMALNRGPVPGAFSAGPNADAHLTGGGILVNSTDPSAAQDAQGTPSRFTVSSPYGLDVNGGATGSWAGDGIPVTTGHQQVPDPFAGFPTPPTAGMPLCNSLAACQDGSGNQTPGIYTVNLGGAGNTNMTLNPGIYILRAGMDTSGNAAVSGTGVLLYNTYSTYPAAPGASPSCGNIKLAGNAATNVSAMTTGTWKNLLVYQDLNCTNGVQIAGNGDFTGTGSFYVPSANFSFSGNNATLIGSQLIADTVTEQNGNFTINYNPSTTAQPILPRLAE